MKLKYYSVMTTLTWNYYTRVQPLNSAVWLTSIKSVGLSKVPISLDLRLLILKWGDLVSLSLKFPHFKNYITFQKWSLLHTHTQKNRSKCKFSQIK